MDDRPDERVGDRYEIVATLGRGGMGSSFLAQDVVEQHRVVLKIPSASMIGDPATFSRFQRELEIGRRLRHPRIQNLLADGRLAGGAPYLVFEYIEGTLLRTYLAERAPLPIEGAVGLAAEIADTLAYCHEQGVVHRDLKPENVIIRRDGTSVILDFGIAFLRGKRRLTFRGFSTNVGTPDYMAPEQVTGDRGDARTDVYALGVMLYEMLTGEVPYEGSSPIAVMGQRVLRDAPPVRTRRSEISPELDQVVRRALRRSPAERYQSMVDFREDLRHLDRVEVRPELPQGMAPHGDLPSGKTVALLLAAVFGSLTLIGVVAEFAHRAQAGR